MPEVLARLKWWISRTLKLKCICLQLDSMTLKPFCNLNDSMLLRIYIPETVTGFGAAFPAQSHSFTSLPTRAICTRHSGRTAQAVCGHPAMDAVKVEVISLLQIHNHRGTACHSPL